MFKILVCGGRSYANRSRVDAVLNAQLHKHSDLIIIHGAAKGADRMAKRWAHAHGIREIPYPAAFKLYGKAAGPIRNQTMLDQKPDLVIAFPGGKGTANMITLAQKANVPTMILSEDG